MYIRLYKKKFKIINLWLVPQYHHTYKSFRLNNFNLTYIVIICLKTIHITYNARTALCISASREKQFD